MGSNNESGATNLQRAGAQVGRAVSRILQSVSSSTQNLQIECSLIHTVHWSRDHVILILVGFKTGGWKGYTLEDSGVVECIASGGGEQLVREFCVIPSNFSPTSPMGGIQSILPDVAIVYEHSKEVSICRLNDGKQKDVLDVGCNVAGVQCNGKILLVGSCEPEKALLAYDVATWKHQFTIVTSFKNGERNFTCDTEICEGMKIPFALGPRWVAYETDAEMADSDHGMLEESKWKHLAVNMSDMAQKASHALYAKVSRLAARRTACDGNDDVTEHETTLESKRNKPHTKQSYVMIKDAVTRDHTLAHFKAHTAPLACMRFSNNGMMLATASIRGNKIKIFEIKGYDAPIGSNGVQLLFVLHRGITQNLLTQISFSTDDMWITASSAGGTIHVFELQPPQEESEEDIGVKLIKSNLTQHGRSGGNSTMSGTKITKTSRDIVSTTRIHQNSPYSLRTAQTKIFGALGSSQGKSQYHVSSHFTNFLMPVEPTDMGHLASTSFALLVLSHKGCLQSFHLLETKESEDDSQLEAPKLSFHLQKEWILSNSNPLECDDHLQKLCLEAPLRPPDQSERYLSSSVYGFSHSHGPCIWGKAQFSLQKNIDARELP